MIVIEELRKIMAVMPEHSRIQLCAGSVVKRQELVPLASNMTELTIFIDLVGFSYYIEDDKWAQGGIADEIIADIHQWLQQPGMDVFTAGGHLC